MKLTGFTGRLAGAGLVIFFSLSLTACGSGGSAGIEVRNGTLYAYASTSPPDEAAANGADDGGAPKSGKSGGADSSLEYSGFGFWEAGGEAEGASISSLAITQPFIPKPAEKAAPAQSANRRLQPDRPPDQPRKEHHRPRVGHDRRHNPDRTVLRPSGRAAKEATFGYEQGQAGVNGTFGAKQP